MNYDRLRPEITWYCNLTRIVRLNYSFIFLNKHFLSEKEFSRVDIIIKKLKWKGMNPFLLLLVKLITFTYGLMNWLEFELKSTDPSQSEPLSLAPPHLHIANINKNKINSCVVIKMLNTDFTL